MSKCRDCKAADNIHDPNYCKCLVPRNNRGYQAVNKEKDCPQFDFELIRL